ncbi:MAG: hypothetical protein K6G64_09090 [Eubacterium sp.]|nr:hypothetical protein [Eubacterium sp.]
MDHFLGEHGEMILYGIVGVMMVLLITTVCLNRWKTISPAYHTKKEKSNADYQKEHQGKMPFIEADEVIYTEYKKVNFNCKDYIHAKDWDGKDLSERLNIYGTVDVFRKGIYQLRCVVVSDSQQICTKYVNVIVE